jgi:FkbM family methyltransferase
MSYLCFVQCGGNDGYSNDPTYHLEKVLGWKGIIVEPLPIYKLCEKNRPSSTVYNCAAGPLTLEKGATISFIDCNAMSFVEGSLDKELAEQWVKAGEATQGIKSKRIVVPIKPIQEIINEHSKKHGEKIIDLFVADTEGFEFSVIQGIDFTKNSPRYILLEIHKDTELEKITTLLEKNGYGLFQTFKQRDFLFKLK